MSKKICRSILKAVPSLTSRNLRTVRLSYRSILFFVLASVFALPFTQAAPQEVTKRSEKTILFIGDSLTEGYGVKKEEAFPEIAAKKLRDDGHAVKIVNGGISGSVSADADRRLKWFLKTKPDILVLALGSNDALKGTPPDVIKKNLSKVIDIALENKIKVLLVGAKVFSNFGEAYNNSLEKMFADLAREKKVAYMPFLLKSVALKPDLNQADMKHPNAKGHVLVGDDVAKELEKIL